MEAITAESVEESSFAMEAKNIQIKSASIIDMKAILNICALRPVNPASRYIIAYLLPIRYCEN